MMQQAVTSTQVSLTPTTTSVMLSLLTSRHIVRDKLNRIIEFIDRHVATSNKLGLVDLKARLVQLLEHHTPSTTITTSSSTITTTPITTSDEDLSNMMRKLEQMLMKPDVAPFVALDPLIEPVFLERNRSFFENKHGFGEHELTKPCEYREPLSTRERRALLRTINSFGMKFFQTLDLARNSI